MIIKLPRRFQDRSLYDQAEVTVSRIQVRVANATSIIIIGSQCQCFGLRLSAEAAAPSPSQPESVGSRAFRVRLLARAVARAHWQTAAGRAGVWAPGPD